VFEWHGGYFLSRVGVLNMERVLSAIEERNLETLSPHGVFSILVSSCVLDCLAIFGVVLYSVSSIILYRASTSSVG
jgi:ATP/ADP translocase